ncbi:glycosyltransferase [Plantactinospora sp. GCM10030261]|uniref:glycosyltransferase n=1 Tax=Plantactinospora sp. GCM10030261 TaxID=3273420 RepID=UPI00361B9918
MRILFVAVPLAGHLYPMAPLASALRETGHEVLLAAGGDAIAPPPAGHAVADIAPGIDMKRIALRLALRHPALARAELAGRAGTRAARLFFGAVNDRLAGPVLDLAERWKPDLVVHEPLAPVGGLVAARLGVAAVLHGNVLFDERALTEDVAGASREIGDLPPSGAVLTLTPASLVGPRAAQPLRPVPHGVGGEVPDWLATPTTRPRILVTRSTVAGPPIGDPMPATLAAAADVDAEFVMVRPPERLVRRRGLPANVRTVDWLPFAAALPYFAAVVHHGGAGTLLAALAAGVPQLVVPGAGDRRRHAELVAARGAGLAVPARKITADRLRRLATDPALGAAAAQVRDEIAAMPAPADVVPLLERLARR